MRAGREEDYHGVAVHPRHLSRYERHVLKCGPADLTAFSIWCPSVTAHLPQYLTVLLSQLIDALKPCVCHMHGPVNPLSMLLG